MAVKFLGQFLLEQGLINKEQLLQALDIQRASNPLLGELAQARGMLDADQAQKINNLQRVQDKRFGDIAQELGLLGAQQIEELLALQKAQRRLLGDILVEQGAVTGDQLQQALARQAAEREQAVQAMEIGAAGHPMGESVALAVDTCSKLFLRTLKCRAQFSSLVQSPADLLDCTNTAHVRIEGATPLVIALASDGQTLSHIAGAFVGLPASQCDKALAKDAFGELINVLMGYLAKDLMPGDSAYRPTPPAFDPPVDALLSNSRQALAVSMTSELGPFVLMLGR